MPRTIYFHKMLRGVVINILLLFTLSNDVFLTVYQIGGRQLGNFQQWNYKAGVCGPGLV